MQPEFIQCPSPECSVQQEKGQKFCSQCGTQMTELSQPDLTTKTGLPTLGVAGLSGQECPLDCTTPDIELAYKHFTLYSGQHGSIPLRIVNKGEKLITRVQLSTKSSAFAGEEDGMAVDREVRLAPGQFTEISECDFIMGEHVGQFAMALHGHYQIDGETPVAFRGRFTLHLMDPDKPGASIVIEDAGSAMMDSVDLHGVDNIIVRDGGAADLGRLQKGAAHVTEKWIPAQVEYDPEKTRLLEEFFNTRQTTQADTIPNTQATFKSRAFFRIGENSTLRTIQIFTGEKLTLGRNPEQANLVTTLLPFSEENRKKGDYISSRHCTLQVENNDTVFLEDLSRNGTSLQGEKVEKYARLRNGQQFCLANVLSYEYQEFRELSELKEVSAIRRNAATIVDYSASLARLDLDNLREHAPLDCFFLNRCDSYRDKLQYLFLRRCVTIGASSTCGLQLEYPSIADKHARLVLLESGYCLEDLNSPGGTRVNGVLLTVGRLEPLPVGQDVSICFGELEVVFKVLVRGE